MYFQTKVIDTSESRCRATISKIVMEGQDVDILKQPGKLTLTNLKEYTEAIWTDGMLTMMRHIENKSITT